MRSPLLSCFIPWMGYTAETHWNSTAKGRNPKFETDLIDLSGMMRVKVLFQEVLISEGGITEAALILVAPQGFFVPLLPVETAKQPEQHSFKAEGGIRACLIKALMNNGRERRDSLHAVCCVELAGCGKPVTQGMPLGLYVLQHYREYTLLYGSCQFQSI